MPHRPSPFWPVVLSACLLAGLTLPVHATGPAHPRSRTNLEQTGCILRVRKGGAGSGASWEDAYPTLQPAINAAAVSGCEVWVAAETYTPTAATNPAVSFNMKDGVAIYGGFAGNETALSQRDWEANRSILSGDIGTTGDSSDNSYHVIYNTNLGSSAVLDGFTIQDGSARGYSGNDYIGGGMFNDNSSPTLRHLIFTHNQAEVGGAYGNASGGSPAMSETLFRGNSAKQQGGAVWEHGSNASFTNVIFTDNRAVNEGGAVKDYGDKTSYTNVLFNENRAGYFGGALSLSGTYQTLTNITVRGNTAGSNGGGIDLSLEAYYTKINNSIVWGNMAPDDPNSRTRSFYVTITHSLVGNCGSSAAWDGTCGDDGGGNLDENPLFTTDLHLSYASPALDAGSNALLAAEMTDLDGAARVFGASVDLGAFEFHPIYVDADATGSGASWEKAYPTLQPAINAATKCGCEVWVATGVYTPTTGSDPAISFNMKDGVAIYGGFAGGETARSQRDWEARPTILSGDIGIGGVNTDNSYHVVYNTSLDSSAILDGFTIQDGSARVYSGSGMDGGGMYNDASSPTLRHLIFTHNQSEQMGGALYNKNSAPGVSDAVFHANSAGLGGAAANLGGSPSFTNIIFSENTADSYGGAVYDAVETASYTNVLFSANEAGQSGGALYINASFETLINTTITGNSARFIGGGIYYQIGSGYASQIRNSILWGNTAPYQPNLSSVRTNTVTNSLVGGCGGSSAWISTCGGNGGGNLDVGPRLTADGHLTTFSPARDAGSNALLPTDSADLDGDGNTTEALPFDLDGNVRVIGLTVDLGAYELPFASLSSIYLPLVCSK